MIEIEFNILSPHVHLTVPATEDSIPIARQVLRSLGETVAADREALEDAELALTEACANAVEHAYAAGEDGKVVVSIEPKADEMHVSVRDFGRGMAAGGTAAGEQRGFGLAMIEGVARRVEIRGGEGTEVVMDFPMGIEELATVDGGVPGVEPAERVLRRLVAVVAAQADMPSDRLMEALLVAELVARYGLRYLVGERVKICLDPAGQGFELRVGPLEPGGADAVVKETDVPGIGSVVERLADGVRTESGQVDGVDGEFLVLQMTRSANAAA